MHVGLELANCEFLYQFLLSVFKIFLVITELLGKDLNPVGALDLGGASTQITFAPDNASSITNAPAGYIHKYDALGRQFSLYTHRYLFYFLFLSVI